MNITINLSNREKIYLTNDEWSYILHEGHMFGKDGKPEYRNPKYYSSLDNALIGIIDIGLLKSEANSISELTNDLNFIKKQIQAVYSSKKRR